MPDEEVKKVEEKKEEGVTIGYELKPLESSSTNEYTLWAVQKVYVNIEFTVGHKDGTKDKHTAGFNFVPTYGHEVRVVIPNKPGPTLVDRPEGTVECREFEYQFEQLAGTVLAYRKRIMDDGKGF